MSQSPPLSPPRRKLRLLALHSFRTSAAIFREQLRRSGLDESLADLVELVRMWGVEGWGDCGLRAGR